MDTGEKILVGLGGLALVSFGYYNAVNSLSFSVSGLELSPDGRALQIKIAVWNPSRVFGLPFPPTILNVSDSNGNQLGTVVSTITQWIPANKVSYVYGIVNANVGTLFNDLLQSVTTGVIPNIVISGNLTFGPISIPINATVNPLPQLSGYDVASYL